MGGCRSSNGWVLGTSEKRKSGTSLSSAELGLSIYWPGDETAFVHRRQGDPADTATGFGLEPSYRSDLGLRHGETKDSGAPSAGRYRVTELLPRAWDLSQIESVDTDPSAANVVTNETAEINLALGETVGVTSHNVPASQP